MVDYFFFWSLFFFCMCLCVCDISFVSTILRILIYYDYQLLQQNLTKGRTNIHIRSLIEGCDVPVVIGCFECDPQPSLLVITNLLQTGKMEIQYIWYIAVKCMSSHRNFIENDSQTLSSSLSVSPTHTQTPAVKIYVTSSRAWFITFCYTC